MNKIHFSDTFGLYPQFLQSHKGDTNVLFLMKGTFEPHLRARVHGPNVSPNFQGGDRGWRLDQPMANDLVNLNYIMNPP